MNKEILEITKNFHNTYEKLASEYAYKTREDTKVFDINSNNGKLMYATVNEIVSPILKENQELKKQLEEINKMIEKCGFVNIEQVMLSYCGLIAQQKEFIKWLEDYLNLFDYRDIEEQAGYDMLEEILQKYKEIIGVKDEKDNN